MSTPAIEIHYADQWAALYVAGQLIVVGDSYLTEKKVLAILGVKTVQDDAFMRGQTARDGVARDLAEVETYRQRRENRKAEAARLRAEAERLLSEAEALDAPAEEGRGG